MHILREPDMPATVSSPECVSHPVEDGLRDVLGALLPPGVAIEIDLSVLPRLRLMMELTLLRVCYELVRALAARSCTRLRLHGRLEGRDAVLQFDVESDTAAPLPSLSALQRTLESFGGSLTLRREASLQAWLRVPA